MILNEDYFKDLEIEDKDIIEDDNLDAYNVEHEVVFRDHSVCRSSHIMYSYQVGICNVLSKYEELRFFSVDSLDIAYIIFYCNMPHFTYKESYYFVDRLQNALWRTESSTVFDNLKITTSPCDLMNFAELYSYTYGNKEISLAILRQHRNDLINNMPYKKFFKDAIYTFNNTTDDFNTVPYLYTEILYGNNPFLLLKKVKNKNMDY